LAKTLAPVLAATVGLTGCAFGGGGTVSEVTPDSAVLHGTVFSATGGATRYYLEYGEAGEPLKTPTRTKNLGEYETRDVSEPVNGLKPATSYRFKTCAEDSENAGHPICGPLETFESGWHVNIEITRDCHLYPPYHGITTTATGLPPDGQFVGGIQPPESSNFTATLTADGTGSFTWPYFGDETAGTWVVSVEAPQGVVSKTLFVDCQAASG
jgi:hypothetical protein